MCFIDGLSNYFRVIEVVLYIGHVGLFPAILIQPPVRDRQNCASFIWSTDCIGEAIVEEQERGSH